MPVDMPPEFPAMHVEQEKAAKRNWHTSITEYLNEPALRLLAGYYTKRVETVQLGEGQIDAAHASLMSQELLVPVATTPGLYRVTAFGFIDKYPDLKALMQLHSVPPIK